MKEYGFGFSLSSWYLMAFKSIVVFLNYFNTASQNSHQMAEDKSACVTLSYVYG